MRQAGPPVYVQIRDAIVAGILDGRYGGEAALPSVRALAHAEAVNPLTVSKAYQELQSAGLVAAKKGVGLYVAPGARDKLMQSERVAFLAHEWPRLRARIERLGITPRELLIDA